MAAPPGTTATAPRALAPGHAPSRPLRFPLPSAPRTAAQAVVSSIQTAADTSSPPSTKSDIAASLERYRERKVSDARSDASSIASADTPRSFKRPQRHGSSNASRPSSLVLSAGSAPAPIVHAADSRSSHWRDSPSPAAAAAYSDRSDPSTDSDKVPGASSSGLSPADVAPSAATIEAVAKPDAAIAESAPTDGAHSQLLFVLQSEQLRQNGAQRSAKRPQNTAQNTGPTGNGGSCAAAAQRRTPLEDMLARSAPHAEAAAVREEDRELQRELLQHASSAAAASSNGTHTIKVPHAPDAAQSSRAGLQRRRAYAEEQESDWKRPERPSAIQDTRILAQLHADSEAVKRAARAEDLALRARRRARFSSQAAEVTSLATSGRSPAQSTSANSTHVPSSAVLSITFAWNGSLLTGAEREAGPGASFLARPIAACRHLASSAFAVQAFHCTISTPPIVGWLVERAAALSAIAQNVL